MDEATSQIDSYLDDQVSKSSVVAVPIAYPWFHQILDTEDNPGGTFGRYCHHYCASPENNYGLRQSSRAGRWRDNRV